MLAAEIRDDNEGVFAGSGAWEIRSVSPYLTVKYGAEELSNAYAREQMPKPEKEITDTS